MADTRTQGNRKKDHYKPLANEDPVDSTFFFNQVLERFDIDLSSPVNQLLIRWKDFVGEDLAGHTRFGGLRNGILTVICDHPSWGSFIRMNSGEIRKRINGAFPEIDVKKIFTRVGNTSST